jgi:hypothetical protein
MILRIIDCFFVKTFSFYYSLFLKMQTDWFVPLHFVWDVDT